jgi:hypothetical protein
MLMSVYSFHGIDIAIAPDDAQRFNKLMNDLVLRAALEERERCARTAEGVFPCQCADTSSGRHVEGCVYVLCLQVAKVIRKQEVPA